MRGTHPAAVEAVADAIERLLDKHSQLTEDEIADLLAAEGIDPEGHPDYSLETILDEVVDDAVPLLGDRWGSLSSVLDGRIFTHRLAEAELANDLLEADLDLAPAIVLFDKAARLADGAAVRSVHSQFDDLELTGEPFFESGLELAPGTLARLGAAAGDLVAVTRTDDGVHLEIVGPISAGRDAALAQTLTDLLDDDPEPIEQTIHAACAANAELFRTPGLPLGESLSSLGFEVDGDLVARPGVDITAWRVERRIGRLADRYDLDDDEALAVLAVVTLYEQVAAMFEVALDDADEALARVAEVPAPVLGSDRDTVRDALRLLAEPVVASAVLDEIRSRRSDAAALGLFAETLEPLAPRRARVAVRWLRGKASELLGDMVEAEKAYRDAEALDPDHPLPLVDLARCASDRGDAVRALSLLRRADSPDDHPFVQLMQHYQPTPRPDLGRNERCWCGSGRKYKQCHLHREELPLAERAAWLYQKAAMGVREGDGLESVLDVAQAHHGGDDETTDSFVAAVQDPLVTDTALFERGEFEQFLLTRGALLPDDERSLAEEWLRIARSLWEIEAVRPGAGLTVRDVRTGDRFEVRERTASRALRVGEYLCARVVPAGDTMQIFGGCEPVALGQRDALIELLDSEPEAEELVEFLTRRYLPPQLQNTEGEPLAICSATVRVSSPDDVALELNRRYGRVSAGESQWHEYVTTDGKQRLRATLTLDGAELTIETNSEPRLDRVLTAVHAIDPSSEVVSETREPAGDPGALERIAARSPGGPSAVLDPSDPDVAAALEQVVRQYETAWLDDSIPALGGHTPRECAADPTRRPDLIRLLDSFPDDAPGTMSVSRLRAALGLA